MKNTKTQTKKLSLHKNTLRQLDCNDLDQAAGGLQNNSRQSCIDGCQYTTGYCNGQ